MKKVFIPFLFVLGMTIVAFAFLGINVSSQFYASILGIIGSCLVMAVIFPYVLFDFSSVIFVIFIASSFCWSVVSFLNWAFNWFECVACYMLPLFHIQA